MHECIASLCNILIAVGQVPSLDRMRTDHSRVNRDRIRPDRRNMNV